MISVIVPVYKVEKYLKRCVRSIQKQTYTDLEIILIDDGSPDACGKICDEFSNEDKRIKVIHKENEGLSAARNTGLQYAMGEYITFVDSDDYISETCYERLINAIEKYETDIAMCGSLCVDENGKVLSQDIFEEGKIYTGKEIVNEYVLSLKTSVWNKLFRKEILINSEFPYGRIHGEDLVFITSLLSSDTRLVTVEEKGYYYVKHEGSITTKGFSGKSFDEVYCKDVAYNNIVKQFPSIKEKAIIWKFRSRMNVIRKMTVNNSRNSEIYKLYLSWLIENYGICKRNLQLKERIEFVICHRFPKMYIKLIGIVIKNR